VGAGALAALLAVAALTAPGDDGGTETDVSNVVVASTLAESVVPAVPPVVEAPLDSVTPVTGAGSRGLQPPAVPDLMVDPNAATPHSADLVQPLGESVLGEPPPKLADVAVSVRVWANNSRVVVRRVDPDGTSEVWLISITGQVRRDNAAQPDMVQSWAVEGGVIVTMRVAGDRLPDTPIVTGLRTGGGGTWLRLPDGAEPVFARPDGALLCTEAGDDGADLTTYQVLR
jgi:hypothetical protein